MIAADTLLVTNEEFCGFLNKSKVTAEGKLITAKKDEIIVVKSIRQSIDSGEFLPVIQKYGLSAEKSLAEDKNGNKKIGAPIVMTATLPER